MKNNSFAGKAAITFAVMVLGIGIGVLGSALSMEVTQNHATGILIDFDEYEVEWYETDLSQGKDPIELLIDACKEKGYGYRINSEGIVLEINGVEISEDRQWGLWYVEKDTTEWVKADTIDIDVAEYEVTAWAYRGAGEVPTVAVDFTGSCFYGYQIAGRVVTLSSLATETVSSLGADGIIVGTDMYSNYPESINVGKAEGKIVEVGTYTDPDFEMIMKQNPDMIVGDGTIYNHIQLCKNSKEVVNSIVLYKGEDLKTILDNTYMTGVAIGYLYELDHLRENTAAAMEIIDTILKDVSVDDMKSVMIALDTSSSPFVAGFSTYLGNILVVDKAINSFSDMNSWPHINTELIAERNPDVIIVVSYETGYDQTKWNETMSMLSDTWKSTTAYKNKDIYILFDGAMDLASRCSPRFPMLMELLGEIIYPDMFDSGRIPKFIGNDYIDLIQYTKELAF